MDERIVILVVAGRHAFAGTIDHQDEGLRGFLALPSLRGQMNKRALLCR